MVQYLFEAMAEFPCVSCKNKTIFRSIEHLEVHIAETHILCLPFSCTICEFGGRFPTETAIITHMKQCHQVEEEFKFYAIFNTDTLIKRKKIGELLERSITISNNHEDQSESQTIPQNCTIALKTTDTEIIQPKAAKIPRLSTVTSTSHCQSTRCSSNIIPDTNINSSQITSINTGNNKTLQLPDTNTTIKPVIGNTTQTNQEKKGLTFSNNGQKRAQKEKKSTEKKISESATKGGYNDVNIEHLFDEMDPKQNATDEEQSQGDGTSSKEDLPKISKGIPQYDFELPPTFFATKPSSKLGLALHKAESEGRDYMGKIQTSFVQKEDKSMDIITDDHMKRQIEVVNKRNKLERDHYHEITKDFERRLNERDMQLKDK